MIPRTLGEQFADLFQRVGEIERRARNRKRTGTVAEVDHAKGLARVKLSEQNGKPLLSPWLPWKEVASGGIKSHIPPTVGEQVEVMSENGDLTDGVIDMSIPSNANPRPHDGPEAVITKGDTRITIADDQTTIASGKLVIEADVEIKGAVAIEGSAVSHNGKDIGDTHKHGGVIPGGGLTDPPV